MKTPIQELIEKLEEKRDLFDASGSKEQRNIRGTYVVAILTAKNLLEKERQVIIEARNDRKTRWVPEGKTEGDIYYTETFKT